jgi:plastocyanin
VHSLGLQLAPVLAAEKSKTAFYIAGAVLVVWALVLSMAIGMRRPSFPDSLRVERGVIAISVVLVLATVAAAVLTSGGTPENTEAATVKAPASTVKAPIAPKPETTPAPTTPAPASKPPGEHHVTTKEAKKKAAKAPAAPTKKPAPAPAVTKLALSVPGTALAYNTKQLSAKAGSVTITLTNSSPLEHDVTVSEGSKVVGATPVFTGGTKSVTLTLKAGSYTFYCSVPGHRQAGMEGTLTVQ